MRIFLKGHATPTPDLGLPAADGTTFPPQSFMLEDGVPFDKTDWVGLGYTNFEVWCIGAAGGRGGDVGDLVKWQVAHPSVAMPADVWANFLDGLYNGYRSLGYSDDYIKSIHYYPGWNAAFSARAIIEGWHNYHNPGHTTIVNTYLNALLHQTDPYMMGGGGGGGGIQVVRGLLADLDTLSGVEIGLPGGDGVLGQQLINGAYSPQPEQWAAAQSGSLYAQFRESWPLPHDDNFYPPEYGGDGGPSSFGGDVCQASGGKGGKPAKIFGPPGYSSGGEGGVGGQIVAGGGAAGAIAKKADGNWETGKDGTWDGSVGQGGGGGHGGTRELRSIGPDRFGQFHNQNVQVPATNGGRGAFASTDRSVYGATGLAAFFQSSIPFWDYPTGLIQTGPGYQPSELALPGFGGGARISKLRSFGSRAEGYDPKGAVFIRITKEDV